MLVYVAFLEWERKLLHKAAVDLGVAERCQFLDSVSNFSNNGSFEDCETEETKFPAVIFLNMDAKTSSWKKSLKNLKGHDVLASIPVVGLGDIAKEEIAEVYRLGGNSYIEKPSNLEDTMHAASTCLSYWLEISLIPGKYLKDQLPS